MYAPIVRKKLFIIELFIMMDDNTKSGLAIIKKPTKVNI
jgi:hypothetical protein